jgi:hypothetical protein
VKGQQHDPAWISATDDEMSYTMGERVRFARTCPGDDEERRIAVHGGTSLFRV